jgi:polysaccharide export outer membrane protein
VWLAACGCATHPAHEFADLGPGAGAGASQATAPATASAQPEPAASAKSLAAPEGSRNRTGIQPETLLLREGDVIRVSFPGAPNLNSVATVRRDGKATLPLVGEIQAAGVSPRDLEKDLLERYGPQLQVKEITVALESSAFPVYVSGSVLRPGKIMSDRPMTPLEAIMEAGEFDESKANLKTVNVIRRAPDGRVEYHQLNLKRAFQGGQVEPFILKPFDIIYVPERFSWF